jgi:hypothetical protein
MRFHLDHIPEKQGFEIDHSQRIFLSGSCFSDHIGGLLKDYKFNALTSPSGNLFNPLSIYAGLIHLMEQGPINENLVLEREGLFFSYLHHSSVHAQSKEGLMQQIAASNARATAFLKETDYLILTFGTAFFYHHRQLNTVVANCHKQPQQVFEKKMAELGLIVEHYSRLIEKLQQFNPKLKIIFTVSPVKYLKDGLVENTLSKAALHLAIHQLIKLYRNCFYFPAYELVNDDLRDYRFYKKDLAHPNEQAIDYVWQKFSDCFFSESTRTLNQKLGQLNQAEDHRTLNPGSNEALKLQDFITRQKTEIHKDYPGLSF